MPEAPASPEGAPVGVRRALFDDRSAARIVRGWATLDGLAAGLDCQVLAGWPEGSAAELAALLERHRVSFGIDRAALEELAQAARAPRASAARVVARGLPAEPGRDGALEFIVRPSSEEARYQHQPGTGRIDFRETNLVENILAGEPAAIEIPPRPGRDGTSVFGKRLAAAPGKPARFRAGEGARFDEKSRQIIAERDGRVVWDGAVVSVATGYHVRGAVDYAVGNIAFVGEVLIDGDVLDGFSVRAGRGLAVGGNVGACQLDSEAELAVKGGVFGKGRARLRAKGSLSARFLNECRAECSGDMVVGREAVGSNLLTNRRLLMTAGSLVGGSASALGGAEVEVIGSSLGVPTALAVGTDYNLTRRQGEVGARAGEVDAAVGKITAFLGPLLADGRRMSRLLERRRDEVERLVKALRGLRAERAALAAELEALAEASRRGAVRQINVRGRVHPGATLEIGSVRHRLKEPLVGPVTILEDRARASLRTVAFKELPASGNRPAGPAV
jgi:hypothetical protein